MHAASEATDPREEGYSPYDHLVELCSRGYWFCRGCGHVTAVVTERDRMDRTDERTICGLCGSPNVRHYAPVL